MSGRINDIAVHPEDKQTWYIGVASGGVWKTTNAGITFTPVFQNEGAYSVGVGRDRSEEPEHDLGRQRRSEQPAQRRLRRRHLSQRRCRPHVAEPRPEDFGAHRPHRDRSARFERRLRRRLRSAVERRRRSRPLQDHRRRQDLDEDPQHQRAHRHQRRRDGSDQSRRAARDRASAPASHLDADPRRPRERPAQVDRRRQDVAAHSQRPAGRRSRPHRAGVLAGAEGPGLRQGRDRRRTRRASTRRTTRGDSWERRGNVQAQPMYYENIHPDPKNAERVYVPNVQTQISDDGGRTFRGLGERNKHVDNHFIWIDPDNTDHLLEGCDGGLYESLGSRPPVAALHQPVGDAVLQRRRRQRLADLQHLRRHAGQQHARRAVAIARAAGRRPTTTGSSSPAATASSRASIPTTRTSSTPNRSTAASSGSIAAPASASASGRSKTRRAGAALQLGIAVHHQPAQPVAALLRREPAVPQRRSRQHLEADQPRPDAADRSQHAAGDGPHVVARSDRAASVHGDVGQHLGAQRIAQARRPALRRHRRRPDPVSL